MKVRVGLSLCFLAALIYWLWPVPQIQQSNEPSVRKVSTNSELPAKKPLLSKSKADSKPQQTRLATVKSTQDVVMCNNLERHKEKFNQAQQGYIFDHATAWYIQGEDKADIAALLAHKLSIPAARDWLSRIADISRFNSSNVAFAEAVSNGNSFNFEQHTRLSRGPQFWRFDKSQSEIDYFQQQVQLYPDIAKAIWARVFFEAISKEQKEVALLSLEKYIDLPPAPKLGSPVLYHPGTLFALNKLDSEFAHSIVTSLNDHEVLDVYSARNDAFLNSDETQNQLRQIVGDDYQLNTRNISLSQLSYSQALEDKYDELIDKNSELLPLENQKVCELSGESQTRYTLVKKASNTKINPSHEKQCGRYFENILTNVQNAQQALSQFGLSKESFSSMAKIENESLAEAAEYFNQLDQEAKAWFLSYALLPRLNIDVFSHLLDSGFEFNSPNIAYFLFDMKVTDGLQMLNKLSNMPSTNDKNQSLISLLVTYNPELAIELLAQGKQVNLDAGVDPLLAMLTDDASMSSTTTIELINALLDSGLKINERHINEIYRLKFDNFALFDELTSAIPALFPYQPEQLVRYQCDGETDDK